MFSNNGIGHIKHGVNKGEAIAFVLGAIVFGITVYAMSLAIKANKLTIKKLNDEGYK